MISKMLLELKVQFARKINHIKGRISRKDPLPLVPRAFGNDKVYKELAKDLDVSFHDPDIRNIGIEGDRASGKSSLIRTYEKRSGLLPFFRYLNISIANCEANSDEKKLTQKVVEEYLLKQILSLANEGDLPNSRYKSIPGKKRKRPVGLIVSIVVSISVWAAQHSFEQWKIFVPEAYRGNVQGYLAVVKWGGITATTLFFSILLFSFKVNLKKIGIETPYVKVEMDSVLKDGIDGNTWELIYALKQMKWKIRHTVVIEDMELISPDECLDIFRKLKNLNKQLNDNLQRHRFYDLRFIRKRPIRFIYCYRNVFGKQFMGDKFFDKIIHMPERLTIDNIGSVIERKIEEEIKKGRYKEMPQLEKGLRFEAEYMSKVGVKFLNDYRDLNRFISRYLREWSIFVSRLGDIEPLEDDPKRLFSFILYQKIWPASINKFKSRNFSELDKCLENNFDEIHDPVDKGVLLFLSKECPESYRVNELCMRFIDFDPSLYEEHYSDYLQAKEADNYASALKCLSKAICCRPQNKELYLERASCYDELGNSDKAAEERIRAASM